MSLRVAVTGAGGRIGRALVAAWATGEVDVTPLASPRSGGPDLRDPAAVTAALRTARPDVVVHLAGLTGGSDAELDEVNARGTRAVVAGAEEAGARRLVLASTAAVYGDVRDEPLSEKLEPRPRSAYGWSKLAAEVAVAEGELESVALRIFNVWGPGLEDSLVARLQRSTDTAPVGLRGPDDFVRDYVHVDDVVDAIRRAATRPLPKRHAVVNIGSGVATSNRALARALSVGRTISTEPVAGAASWSVADPLLAETLLGWRARHPLGVD